MANNAHLSSTQSGKNSFMQHLENASKTVTSWPEWKQTVLGTPVDHSNHESFQVREQESGAVTGMSM